MIYGKKITSSISKPKFTAYANQKSIESRIISLLSPKQNRQNIRRERESKSFDLLLLALLDQSDSIQSIEKKIYDASEKIIIAIIII